MKDEFSGQTNKGFSTLEILIAMAILILVLSSVIMVAFGGQAILSDNEIAGEALKKAQELLEVEQARARKDFKLVNPVPEVEEIVGGLTYKKWVEVETASDYLTKEITSIVAWTGEHGRNLDIRLTALVTNFENAIGGDTCDSVVTGPEWTAPIYATYAFAEGDLLPSGITGNFPVADIDVSNGKLYAAINDTSVNTDHALFVFDSSNPSARPPYLGSADNAPTRQDGINAIHAAEKYVYAASAVSANFGPSPSCTQGPNCAQLQIFNVANPSSIPAPVNFKVPGVFGSGGQATGKSIFYKNGYAYLGLSKTASGPEFNIIDVREPSNIRWIGGWSAGNAVNAIYVRKNFAYVAVATDSGQELFVLDISNPVNPVAVSPGGFDAPSPGIGGYGKSIYAVGDTLYFGRTFESSLSGEEFYILNNENSASPLPLLGARDIGESVNGIIVRDFLAFVLLGSQLQIMKISNPASIDPAYAPPFLFSGTNVGKTLDCEGNYLYIGTADSSTNAGTITLVKPGS